MALGERMSIRDISKKPRKDAPVVKGTGFYIDGFGHVSIEYVQSDDFDKKYDKRKVERAMQNACDRLFDAIDISVD